MDFSETLLGQYLSISPVIFPASVFLTDLYESRHFDSHSHREPGFPGAIKWAIYSNVAVRADLWSVRMG